MNIRQKCAAAIAVSLAISAALNIAVLRVSVFPSFIELEEQEARSDIHRAVAAIEAKIASTALTVRDYANRDESYTFALKGGDEYLTQTYATASVAHLSINFVSIHDRNGKVLFQASYKTGAEELQPPGPLALSVIDPRGVLLATSDGGGRRGLLMTANGPLIIASRSILRSDVEGPFAGTFIMARYLDERMVADLNEATHVAFRLINAARPEDLDAEAAAARDGLLQGAENMIADARDGKLAVYALLRDLNDQPAVLVRATIDRSISQAGLEALLLAVGGIVAAGLVVLAVTTALLQRLLVGPISHLTEHLLTVGSSGDLSRRVGLKRSEIGLLARQFDDMLEKLAEARRQLLDQSYSAGVAEMAGRRPAQHPQPAGAAEPPAGPLAGGSRQAGQQQARAGDQGAEVADRQPGADGKDHRVRRTVVQAQHGDAGRDDRRAEERRPGLRPHRERSARA